MQGKKTLPLCQMELKCRSCNTKCLCLSVQVPLIKIRVRVQHFSSDQTLGCTLQELNAVLQHLQLNMHMHVLLINSAEH